jgi:hypothetical protein
LRKDCHLATMSESLLSYQPTIPFGLSFFFFCLLAFFAILFLQSGIDKVIDRKGNLEWLTGHFSKSPIANQVPVFLTVITGMELLSGALNAVSSVLIFFVGPKGFPLPFIAMAAAMLTLLALFFGQRIAKDYAGASGIVPYFIVGMFGTLFSSIYLIF